MTLNDLTKKELCELVTQILKSPYHATYTINKFLIDRWAEVNKKLLDGLKKIDIMKDFTKFNKINKQLDKLHNNSDYYLQLDELKKDGEK